MIRISGDVLVNKYVSLRDGGLNTAAFVAGVVNGVLDAAEFVRTPTHIPLPLSLSLQCTHIALFLSRPRCRRTTSSPRQ